MTAAHQQELADLETYFETAIFPKPPFMLNKYMRITGDIKLFIAGEAAQIRDYNGKEIITVSSQPVSVRDSLFKHLRELKKMCIDTKL